MNQIVKQGDVIFTEGEPGDCAYILERGKVRLSILLDGEQRCISELQDGAVFGEMVLIDNHMRSATATAVEDTELIVIPSKYFQEKLEGADKFITLLLKVLLQRYREMRARLNNISHHANCKTSLFIGGGMEHDCERDALQTARQVEAEHALGDAFTAGQLELFYQPIVTVSDGKVIGCESLIRWRHPERGLVPPIEFICLAEKTGLIVPIGLWIVEEAAQASLRFCKLFTNFDFVSINLSGKQFAVCDLAADVQRIFDRHQIHPEKIKFEITESILMANPVDTELSLNAFKQNGSSIAIDDFGTGYSSFSYLHRFPIDTLKIDRVFVSTMRENPKSYEIVKSLCILAKAIGMSIVAEGVETAEEHRLLSEMGVDYGQGYYYAKPMPETEFCDYLSSRQAAYSASDGFWR